MESICRFDRYKAALYFHFSLSAFLFVCLAALVGRGMQRKRSSRRGNFILLYQPAHLTRVDVHSRVHPYTGSPVRNNIRYKESEMKFKKKALPLTTAILACSLVSTPLLAHSDKAQENFMLLEQEKASNTVYKAYFPSLDIARKAAISFHGQMLESHYDDGYLIMELTDEEMDKLKVFGFTFAPATEFIEKRNAVLSKIQAKMAASAQPSD